MEEENGKQAVVIVDMQEAFCNRWTEGLGEKTADFLEEIRDTGILVVGTQYLNHENTPCYLFEDWKECMAGTPETEILPLLLPYLQRVFKKDRFSCWTAEMKQFVREEKIKKLYFAGVNTGCCILHSVLDCYNDLTDCSVIADLCGSTSGPEEHEAALVVLKSCITERRVISAAEAEKEIRAGRV